MTNLTNLTFKRFQLINAKRSKAFYPQCQDWTEAEWMMALMGEIGEAANIMKKRLRDKEDVRPGLALVAGELADVLCYISLLCSYLGLDMDGIVREKFNEVTMRNDPTDKQIKEFML